MRKFIIIALFVLLLPVVSHSIDLIGSISGIGLTTIDEITDIDETIRDTSSNNNLVVRGNLNNLTTQTITVDSEQVDDFGLIHYATHVHVVVSDSGSINLLSNPQIVDGVANQTEWFCGDSNSNFIILDNGNGLVLTASTSISLTANTCIKMQYRNNDWYEIIRTPALVIAGTDTQVIYNDSGVLAGSPNLTFSGTVLTSSGGFTSVCDPTVSDCNQQWFHELDNHPGDPTDTGLVNVGFVDDCLEWFVGSSVLKRVCAVKPLCYNLESPTDADNFIVAKIPKAITVLAMNCIVGAATSAVVTFQETDSNAANPSTIEAVTCSTTNTADNGIDNASIDAGDWIRIDIGTVTGTVGQVTACLYYQ